MKTIVSDRKKRISSIDLLRGVVMVIMALDHVREYFHYDAYFFNPVDLERTNPWLFFTRFITHFCAPVFVFLAGTSAHFVGKRITKKALSIWLLKRGLWLVIAELTIIKMAWMFKLDYSSIVLQVIWVLGVSMMCLAGLLHLPRKWGIGLALLVVFGHNLLDQYQASEFQFPGLWNLTHEFGAFPLGSSMIFVGYPFIPWIFVMLLGYHFGNLYTVYSSEKRKKYLQQWGLLMIALFIVFRFSGIYGDPYSWDKELPIITSILSFFNVTKYPPSICYLLITLGPSLLFLRFTENASGKWVSGLTSIGRVPMFFYIVHLYFIHFLALIAISLTLGKPEYMVIDLWISFQSELQGYGFSLGVVYLVWILVVFSLYPLCLWYDKYKSNNRDKWWLSYL